jgi:hypothetical protein
MSSSSEKRSHFVKLLLIQPGEREIGKGIAACLRGLAMSDERLQGLQEVLGHPFHGTPAMELGAVDPLHVQLALAHQAVDLQQVFAPAQRALLWAASLLGPT